MTCRNFHRDSARELSRRHFLAATAASAVVIGASGSDSVAARDSITEFPAKLVIAGEPRERGFSYGKHFGPAIQKFVDREILSAFVGKPASKDELLKYAAACVKPIRNHCPIIFAEMEGMADGSGIELTELVLLTLHEELYHRGVLPMVEHCTAVAVGPPATADGSTLVGQTWDWMESVFGLSSVVEWQRKEGPSLLAYGFPGLWVGAGMNAAGIALTWTSADLGVHKLGVRVGVPSYVFLAHLLYQDSLDAVIREAKKNMHAGWFTFVMAGPDGRLLNVEGSPAGISVEESKSRLVRIGFGTREMTSTPPENPIKTHPRCEKMLGHLNNSAEEIHQRYLQRVFEDPQCAISVGRSTIDMMVFNTTTRQALLSRGPAYGVAWKAFSFEG